ncbi:MAG: DUF192 domain-containing protein [Saprospiraceae bacterium]
MNRANRIIFFVVLILGIALFIPWGKKIKLDLTFKHQATVFFQNDAEQNYATFKVEVADTEEKQTQGLMHRTAMKADQGMLFIMEEEEIHSFWMDETYLSLDVVFIDTNKEVVFIAKGTEPKSQEPIRSLSPSQYVLEIMAGTADQAGIKVGDQVSWEFITE